MDILEGISNFFAHPFVLLVTGAIITSFIIPKMTNRWQDHKKKIEIKVDLVSQISEIVALARIISLSGFLEKKTLENALDNESKSWMVKGDVITARLKAYFNNSNIPDKWDNFLHGLIEFWGTALFLTDDKIKKIDTKKLRSYFPRANDTDFKSIEDKSDYMDAMVHLESMIMTDGQNIVDRILKEKIVSF